VNVDTTQNIISFCTGYGGIELGLRQAGVDVREICYVEIEAYAIANLVAKIEENKLGAAPVWTDIKTFPAEIFRGKVHGITGGYPCQPFSHAGQRKGTDDPRHLWPYILEHVRTIRPVWCFFENVEGHLTLGFKEVFKSLRDLGYSVEAGLFTASEVGAPHRRKRLFILAYTESEGFSRGRDGDSAERREECQGYRGRIQCGIANTSLHRWPARPGQQQYEWEEPRTIKSSMGCAIDGVNAGVDMLRLLGNGVVPQTAAKAWITLNANAARTSS